MSGLVDRVRSTIRSRSRSRRRSSISEARSSVDAARTEPLPNNGVIESEKYGHADGHHSISQRAVDDMSPQSNDTNQQNINNTGVPSSRHARNASAVSDAVPERVSSLRPTSSSNVTPKRRPVSGSYDQARSPTSDYSTGQYDGAQPNTTSPSGRSAGLVGHKTSRSVDVAANDPSPLVPRSSKTNNTSTMAQARKPVSASAARHEGPGGSTITTSSTMQRITDGLEHLRLPDDFDLNNSQHTHVETRWLPAVTREEIQPHRTEIVQKAITRDVHVHHYYTYVQPLKVVEVLPAKHYRVDEVTGEKVEIPAPEGFVMPEHLSPRIAEIPRGLKGEERHYLVDEAHPRGVNEAPPLNYKPDFEPRVPGATGSRTTDRAGL